MFIFDISSEYKLKNLLADNTFADDGEDVSWLWFNTFKGDRVEMDISVFTKQADGSYKRADESQTQFVAVRSPPKSFAPPSLRLCVFIASFTSSVVSSTDSERCVAAGGVVMQLLPGTTEENMDRAENAMQNFTDPADVISKLGADGIMEKFFSEDCAEGGTYLTFPEYKCNCSHKKIEGISARRCL